MTLNTWVLIVVLATIWGSSFLFARIAVLEIPPLTLVFARVALAALALNLLLALRSTDYVHSASMRRNFAAMGVLDNIIPFCIKNVTWIIHHFICRHHWNMSLPNFLKTIIVLNNRAM